MAESAFPGDAQAGGRFAALWPLLWLAWLPFLATPVAALVMAPPAAPRLAAIGADLTAFGALYLWAAWHNLISRPAADGERHSWQWRWLPLGVLTALSLTLIFSDGVRWLDLLTFTSACAGVRLATGRALGAVGALVFLTAVVAALGGAAWLDLVQALFLVGGIGCGVIILSWAVATSRALRTAREEIARLAVEAERLRFARDLHDLLGHDLARIALQSEVIEAVAAAEPRRAAETARELGEAARTALREVRAAVAGYRQPTLGSELRAAAAILDAAGIACRIEGKLSALPPTVEAVLAWTVREGVTNVVKHSRARCCTITLERSAGGAAVAVRDDGRGAAARQHDRQEAMAEHGGSGLPGLAERAAALGGRCAAGPLPAGGFHLLVSLPLGGVDEGATKATVRTATGAGTGGRP